MKTISLIFIFLNLPAAAFAGFANYNSILVGNKAAGMGGAFTALTGDPASSPFYNPATLARMEGQTLSSAVNIFNKYDTEFGGQFNVSKATQRINQGNIVPVPSSTGTVHSFRNFTYGLSIVLPDFDLFSGEVQSSNTSSSFVNFRDESVWIGGSFALNVSEKDSVGLTLYYTSRSYFRSVTDKYEDGADTINFSEEKTYSKNSLIYILGYAHQLSPTWSAGLSARLPSLEVSSKGAYFQSQIGTVSGAQTDISQNNLNAQVRVPAKVTLGLGFERKQRQSWAFDVSYYAPVEYNDLDLDAAADHFKHEPTWNVNLGGETYLKKWLALRYGVFTNFSSQPEIDENPTVRGGDHIDMWGFSMNFSIFTSANTSVTLGGYYTGGDGHSVQRVEGQNTRIDKSLSLFSFLAGTSFNF